MGSDPADAGRLALEADHTMVVVTAASSPLGDMSDGGCLVGFHSQASIDPWRHLVCLSLANHTHGVAATSTHLAVHFLPLADGDGLAKLFGATTLDDHAAKLTQTTWQRSPHGPAILDGVAAWFVGEVVGRLVAGDHEAFLLEPVEAYIPASIPTLLRYSRVHRLEPGHEANEA
jgi:flavin reductase (DIM6/NTAB) family NADH-FMN oxidoreductase RutF